MVFIIGSYIVNKLELIHLLNNNHCQSLIFLQTYTIYVALNTKCFLLYINVLLDNWWKKYTCVNNIMYFILFCHNTIILVFKMCNLVVCAYTYYKTKKKRKRGE